MNDHVAEPFRTLLNDFSREFVDTTRLEARDALRAVVSAYDLALKDEQTKIPTYLHAAIENARRVL